MGRPSRFSPEVRERAVRLVWEHRGEYASEWEALQSIGTKFGCTAETLRKWVRQAERDAGRQPRPHDRGTAAAEGAGARAPGAEAQQRDSQDGVRVFRSGGARPPGQVGALVAYIDAHRDRFGVEPICRVLPIAPSTYPLHHRRQRDPTRRCARAQRDDALRVAIQRVWDENHQGYGPRKVWRALRRQGCPVAHCTVRRLMKAMGLAGVVRGRAWVTTTYAAPDGDRSPDLVERNCTATRPNQLWVSDFTYVATWRGVVYVAFVIDVFARRIVGWRVSASLRTDFVLDALEQAIHDRRGDTLTDLVHHSDRGTQGRFNRSSQHFKR